MCVFPDPVWPKQIQVKSDLLALLSVDVLLVMNGDIDVLNMSSFVNTESKVRSKVNSFLIIKKKIIRHLFLPI